MSDQGTVGPPTEKTLANIARAKAYSVWCGPVHVEWKLWTDRFRVIPRWDTIDTELWNEGPVRWTRAYWLSVGVSMYRALPERRVSVARNFYERERRLYPYGTNQIQR